MRARREFQSSTDSGVGCFTVGEGVECSAPGTLCALDLVYGILGNLGRSSLTIVIIGYGEGRCEPFPLPYFQPTTHGVRFRFRME